MNKLNRKAWVSGRVQGVSYRASTQLVAQRLGLNGYAKNLLDGRVEVLISGEKEGVEALTEWLYQGPRFAEVHSVEFDDLPFTDIEGFKTL